MANNCTRMTILKLSPFISTTALYFALAKDEPEGILLPTLLKCLPIFGLIVFVLIQKWKGKKDKYSRNILYGLILSVIGDALLSMDLFSHGMFAFALAQICYITAYGFKPLKIHIALPFYAVGLAMFIAIYEKLEKCMRYGVPIYAFLLATMVWRSFVQANTIPKYFNKWCAFGSLMFAVSDAFIAIDKFYAPIPNAGYYIMGTYYFAQCTISLSILNSIKLTVRAKKNRKKRPKKK